VRSLCVLALMHGALAAAATIERVWPDKMMYDPNQPAELRVDIRHDAATNLTVTLAFDLVSRLDSTQQIARQRLSLEPQRTNTVSFAWNTGRRDYGHAAVVSLVDDEGRLLDRKETFFSITDNLWKVAQLSMVSHFQIDPKKFDDAPDGERLRSLRHGFLGSRNHAANYYEFFGWAPDDFFELAPVGDSEEIWRGGTMGYLMSRRYARGVIAAAHDAGLRVVTYLQPFAMGRRTVEEFRRRPDWFAWDEFGQPQLSFTHKQLAEWRAGQVDLYAPCSVAGSLNLAHREVVDAGIDQIVAAARRYGFDGCRFDNTCYTVPTGIFDSRGRTVARTKQESDALTARALDRLRARLERELSPRFVVGHNFAFVVRDLNPVAWDRIASRGWVIVDEMTNRLFMPPSLNRAARPNRPWMDFVRTLQAGRDAAWRLGGHYQMIGMDSDEVKTPNPQNPDRPHVTASEATRLYMNICTFASGVHPYSYHYAPGIPRVAEYWRFAARYSALLWDNRMQPLTNPELVLSVNADRAVWWKEFVYWRNEQPGEAQTILHLVNPPLHPIHENPTGELPGPIERIRVESVIPDGCALHRVVWLAAEPKTTLTGLAATAAAGRVSVVVPKLDLWGMVVFEWKTSGRPALPEAVQARRPGKVHEDESTRQQWIESTQVKVSDRQPWTVQAEAYNVIAEKVADPDAHNGQAVLARKGVAQHWYMVTATYSYRERFGRYRFTFRLKCADTTTTNNVIRIGVGVEGVPSPGESVGRVLKGTDFAAPNRYQEFAVEMLRSDVGFLGYIMTFEGGGDVWADSITIERLGDTTDLELAAKLGAPRIEAKPLTLASPRALWVQGLLHEHDAFGGALEQLGIPHDLATVDQVQSGTVLTGFPKSWDEIARYSVVLLSDTDPRGLRFGGRALLKAWVEQGGTLIVTGGPFAFGKGLTKNTFLGEILPVETTGRWDMTQGGRFAASKPPPTGLPPYRGACNSFFVQRTRLKPGAEAALRVGDMPVLASHSVGRGKVIVFTGTSLENRLRLNPFWTDPA
jgi:hypothetical protein